MRISHVERIDGRGQNDCLQVWWLTEKGSLGKAIPALAQGVAMLLKRDKPLLVSDPKTHQLRPAIGSDIVILCRSNDRCGKIAHALSNIKLSVATERDNLLKTPECALAFSCLRYLIDSHDTLASAEIAHILEGGDGSGKWFVNWLTDGREAVEQANPQFAALREAASGLINLTPTEVLETAIFRGGVVEVVKRFGSVRQRMANLDALRGLALQYEELCRVEKRACTPGGLVSFLSKVEKGGQQPPDPDKNAVRVATYHSAKGLEWPIVILFDLHEPRVPNPFGVSIEPRDKGIDPTLPLKDRWIRFWPWPYGNHKKDVGLDAAVANSPEMQRVIRAAEAENTRLLYVGMTRARDYLIFAPKSTTPASVEWLSSLRTTKNSQVLSLPEVPGEQNIHVGKSKFPCDVQSLDLRNVEPELSISSSSTSYTTKKLPRPAAPRLPYRLIPSAHLADSIQSQPDTAADTSKKTSIISIGARLPLVGSPDMRDVGDALHRFLAVDNIEYPDDERLKCATAILNAWSVTALNSDSLVLASNRLNSFITEKFGACKRLPECPITGRIGEQRVSGRLDLLIETDAGYIIIDHKSFPGRFEEWIARAQSHKPQLDIYKQVVEQATSRPVLQILIHMPIVASIVTLA